MDKDEEKSEETSKGTTESDPFRDVRLGKLREIGSQSFWTLSSCKPANPTAGLIYGLPHRGFGVDQLRDDLLDTYWQSDGGLPHLVSIEFKRKTTVSDVCIYTDFKLDESYTPSRISVRAGASYNDIQEIEVLDLHEPAGWIVIPVKDAKGKPLRTFMIQIAIMSNHQNGRDTHIRQIKIHSPVQTSTHLMPLNDSQSNFQTVDFLQYSCIR